MQVFKSIVCGDASVGWWIYQLMGFLKQIEKFLIIAQLASSHTNQIKLPELVAEIKVAVVHVDSDCVHAILLVPIFRAMFDVSMPGEVKVLVLNGLRDIHTALPQLQRARRLWSYIREAFRRIQDAENGARGKCRLVERWEVFSQVRRDDIEIVLEWFALQTIFDFQGFGEISRIHVIVSIRVSPIQGVFVFVQPDLKI